MISNTIGRRSSIAQPSTNTQMSDASDIPTIAPAETTLGGKTAVVGGDGQSYYLSGSPPISKNTTANSQQLERNEGIVLDHS